MKNLSSALFAFLLLASSVFGQDVPLMLKGDFNSVKVARLVTVYDDLQSAKSFPFDIILPAKAFRPTWTVPAGVVSVEGRGLLTVVSAAKGEWKVAASWGVIDFEKGETREESGVARFLVGDAGPVPPAPPAPPTPPQPITSFRVVFIWESAKTLPLGQIAVMDAKVVRDYLTANTTPEGGFAGWRKYDKDQDSSKDQPTINAMWTATQPKVTTVPCVAVEVNGRVEIVPLAASPAEMVATFQKYKGGK